MPITKKLVTTWRNRSERYADACNADASALLPHMTTIDAAKDMDSIRQALGVAQINYYGFSYGTYLGQVYATLFPGHIRRAVFDTNVDPRNVWYQANLNQDIAFQRNIEIWFRWVAKYDRTYQLGKTGAAVEKQYYAVARQLRRSPPGAWSGRTSGTTRSCTPGTPSGLDLPRGRLLQVGERPRPRRSSAPRRGRRPGDDNGFAVYNAVQCTDVQWPHGVEHVAPGQLGHLQGGALRDVAQHVVQRALPDWAGPGRRPDHGARRWHRVLLIDETSTRQRRIQGSLDVRQRFPASSLIAEPGGTTHAGSLWATPASTTRSRAYLATGHLPPRQPGYGADVECEPLPRPVPETSRALRPAPSLRARLIPIYGP